MKELKKRIPLTWIIKFNLRMIFKEKSFIVLNLIFLIFTLFISIFSAIEKNNAFFLKFYDYYLLIGVFVNLFLICLRLVQFFYISKVNDKTLNIQVVQQISRRKLFLYNYFTFILLTFIICLIPFILLNSINYLSSLKFSWFIFKISLTFFAYSFASCLCFIGFFSMITLFSNIQVSTIMATLIMSITFISNLPYLFLKQGEDHKLLKLNYQNEGFPVTLSKKVNMIYDSYDLKKHVLNGQIRFPDLSLEIFNNFIENKYLTDTRSSTSFETSKSIEKRINFWKTIGVIEEKSSSFSLDQPTRIVSMNKNFEEISDWKNNNVTFKFNLKYKFLSIEEIQEKINRTEDVKTKKVLTQFVEYTNYIFKYKTDFKSFTSNLFEHFIFFDDKDNKDINWIENKSTNQKVLFQAKYLADIYQYHYSPADHKLGLDIDNSKDLIENSLFFKTMLSMHLLENYFLNYTDNLTVLEDSTIATGDETWEEYEKSRNLYNLLLNVNFTANVLQNYRYFGGESYDDIWFEPESRNKIFFNKQDNLFITKPGYKFKLDTNNKIVGDTYNNFVPPYYYAIAQIILGLINNLVACLKFKRMDLNG
ncbi:ABC transporter permease [Spiroplasma floricola]|uniref:ABC transporter permease n=1 Tax=Spiroplasma floricola 23-6 TaxID=1336749 RepID=A0A2K8SDZ2_9MOLU|nr:ABC transporter permease [Spiroplasma floricola]AUB31684.1 ABC transporter permease [Spiroplasma floricola 23-6]